MTAGTERLLASDFDKTTHRTSEPAPNGMTVELAYEHAVNRVFGDVALTQYRDQKGLQNRAPIEVVKQFIPIADSATQRSKTEDLIAAKLDVLLSQVGMRTGDSVWPRLNDGFAGLWAAASNEPTITTGIVSSGHEDFIRRAFEVHDLLPPDLFVTDDMMRPLLEHLPDELCVKPSRLLLDTLHYQWLRRCKLGPQATDDPMTLEVTREDIVYVGDDIWKDGGLARNAGVSFIHIPVDAPVPAFRALGTILQLEMMA